MKNNKREKLNQLKEDSVVESVLSGGGTILHLEFDKDGNIKIEEFTQEDEIETVI